jgi:hypothetical protein
MHPSERQLHLRLHPSRTRHTKPRRLLDRVIQQRRLADAGFTAQD